MAIDIIARGMIEESYIDISHLSEQIDSHTGNGNIHVTTVDKNKWNGYDAEINQNKSDISALYEITSSGETVDGESSYTLTNAVDFPLMGLNLYGRSVQDGTPTPNNPVDIVSVGDNGFDIISKDDTHFNLLSIRDNGGDIITKQPCSMVAKVGETATFSVVASGTSLSYQWWQDVGNGWIVIDASAARKATFSIPVASFRNGYKYRCVATDGSGNVETSDEVTLYVVSDDCEVKTASIVTDALPWCGIPVDNVRDEFIYNADGTGKIIKRTARIDSYNGETISGAYISTTGSLTTGATVIYQLDTPLEIPLTSAEISALKVLQTFDGTTSISNSANADMSVKYCTNKALSEFVLPITKGLQAQIDELRAAVLSLGGNV